MKAILNVNLATVKINFHKNFQENNIKNFKKNNTIEF